jgi:sulfide:quinone oxidoreductase
VSDGPAVFSQPPMPIKCPGAPQKIVYLAADYVQKQGKKDIPVIFNTATPGIFGVPYFARALMGVVEQYGVNFTPSSNLTAVDGEKKIATFTDSEGTSTETPFGMLHVTPPQCAPKFISESVLSDDAGWLDVDKNNLQSTKYPNIFGLGDATNTPNSKTAAAIRKQAPVVVKNLAALKRGAALSPGYDGYASCPLTTSYGKMILAEFRYGGEVTPTIPLSPKVPQTSYWYLKKWGLAIMYWDYMLKGYEWDVPHNVNFIED